MPITELRIEGLRTLEKIRLDLDGLTDPAKSVVLCSLDERGATRLVRPDREALAKWLERYRGLGDIRGAGHAASVMTKVEPQ